MTRRRRAVALAALATTLVWLAIPARAQAQVSGASVRIREVSLEPNGLTRVIVGVSGLQGSLTADEFRVTEAGRSVSGVSVTPLDRLSALPVAVALVFDVSGSTVGRPLADAKRAGKSFIGSLPRNVRVAVVAFGDTASVRVGFTTDRRRLSRTIDSLRASGGTALYDGVVTAARLLGRVKAQRNIVVFSDGDDSASRLKLSDAVSAAKGRKAPVTAIGLNTVALNPSVMAALAEGTGGRSVRVSGSRDLTGAFTAAARDIASQYVLSYSNPPARGPADLEIAVTVRVGTTSATDRVVTLNPRTAASATPQFEQANPARPLVPAFASDTGLLVGVGAAFAGLFFFLAVLIRRPKKSEESTVLTRALRLYVRGANREKGRKLRAEGGSALARRAAEVVDRVPKPAGYEERLQRQLERAGWPFRAGEFLAIQGASAIVGAVIGWGLLGRWLFGVVFAVLGPLVLRALLKRKVASRQAAFLEQLPDTLQLLAGSLQAGYGFMQALDTLVKEAAPPTSTEFQRVLTEARLGMSVDDAMNMMSERIGSEDFKWVVLAINIQRQVGGNLAMLLRTVAETLRERERVRRQIKVLSAEGRLSAWILGSLPFAIAGYISLVNPEFLAIMTTERLGRIMLAVAVALLGAGIAWMRKIIRIEV